MLRRKAYDYLLDWKSRKHNECLLIKGARQVGKTFLVELFGKNEYSSFIEINFIKNPHLKDIFDGSLSAAEIYKKISLYIPGCRLIPGDTLIFLDEIQICSKARTALKFLAQDGNYDVIASGSLLGLIYGMDADREVEEVESVPVGFETQFTMYSLDFEEFLWAYGYESNTIDILRDYYISGEHIPDDINRRFINLFREYIVVGGMPEVVDTFIRSQDFNMVRKYQNKILSSYYDDISNHAKKTEKPKIRMCYKSIPFQLARENRKFSYACVESRGRAKKFADSIMWLCDSNIVNSCYNVSYPEIPINAYEINDEFKLYVNDTGLLMALYGDISKQKILDGSIKGPAKGGIYENVIAECLVKNGFSLHYFRPDSNNELEFLIETKDGVIPIEVKSGNNPTVSLNRYMEKFNPEYAIKFVGGNIGFFERKKTLPHYMVMFLKEGIR